MSIERKIREMETGLVYGSADFFSGVDFAKHRAAEIAKDGDTLMRLLAEDLYDQCTNPNEYTDALLERYKQFRSNSK